MLVQQLRREKGWSQEHLAHVSGLSVRTIQRIENGKKAGPESLKCLAAVFEINVTNLIQENTMSETEAPNKEKQNYSREENANIEYIENLKSFHLSWISYIIIIPALFILNIYVSPNYYWVVWPALGWGIGIAIQTITIYGLFNLFGPKWEQRQLKKRMDENGIVNHRR